MATELATKAKPPTPPLERSLWDKFNRFRNHEPGALAATVEALVREFLGLL